MNQKTKMGIGILILLIGFGYLMFSGISSSSSYFLTIEEVLAQGKEVYGKPLKVSGLIIGESIDWNAEELQLNFKIKEKDGNEVMAVRYSGVRPDNFKEGVTAIVQGTFTKEGYFKADKLMLKCPSKYEEENPERVKEAKNNE
ncbi:MULTISPECIES: cytochrome c maturation protein CcmE [unclassified Candidatus Frackibacter]|uniref:cytochrome c maturation protein CcmE n=1 Tax=unclassified Candidatus Frackibacter TaxID=2648818 RepID=UPI000792C001|nr:MULTISPECIES: cytochrome c maturation protein CcmE [unclassified Candidatus Frackibacter]KXS43929.1 MAG: cytochrome c-type bioproteinis protein CcmE [Candidatus Frackibacter sp. T328-2]SDC40198.1 cytochrome c-type biogenesis protein CcmE [Candidatus Frackibacter sp. WG11]SEM60563.1 cytochrome c-type biogenesis protein CcmE [Candidatus Frackibacter sp. WG12]SFL61414.1 cytochrome c-type biogenesis protein CcmE [Candidatus Frackibacter sp. WG13]